MKKRIIIPILAIIFTPFLLQAQTDGGPIQNTFGIGPRLGYYKSNDAEDGNFYGGVQGRLRFGRVLGLEGSVEYRAGQRYGVSNYSVKTKFVPVTASLLFFIPLDEHFAPYGLAGLGAYYTVYDYSADANALGFDDDHSFNMGYHLGFGLELPVNTDVALNADYRYLFLNPNDNQENLDNTSFSGNVFTAGLTFYL